MATNTTVTCIKRDVTNITDGEFGSVEPVLEKYQAALLLLLGFGGVSIILALLHRLVRTRVFRDSDNVDTAFDAGGRVSTSLTAVTVASQFLWPGDLLQSSTITVKSGISGPLWYTVGAAVNIALFPVVSVYLKTRAPGAKTFLQIMKARYGKPAHVIFIIMALLVNLCVISTLIVAGVSTIQAYTREASDEFCVLIIAVLFGSYSLIGGLGTTFYVSYFNAVLIFVILIALNVKILYSPGDTDDSIGSFDKVYSKLQCLLGPEGNEDRSYLTFESENGIVWAFMGLCVTASLTYCDQAAWQSRVAAKPMQGVLGFLIASYIWFAIPISISTSAGLAYLSMASDNSTNILAPGDIDAGLVTPFMAQRLLGNLGGILIVTMTAMTLMSTGSGEVMAVSSIIVYDIYQIYVNPFRQPQCSIHGAYRLYQENMLLYKSWCILWVTIGIVPLGLLVIATGIDLNWAMLFGFIITLPCFPPVILSIFWSKTTRSGVISGALFGVVCGVGVALGVASTYEGGLNEFLRNTVQNYTVIAGAGTSIGVSFLSTVLVSCGTHAIRTPYDVDTEWQKLRSIDNPLYPWSDLYAEDIPDLPAGERPSVESLDLVFKRARVVAYVGGFVTLALFVGVVPGVMIGMDVLDKDQFETWTNVLQFFCFSMAGVVVVVAPVEEVVQICRRALSNRREKRRSNVQNYAYDMPEYDR